MNRLSILTVLSLFLFAGLCVESHAQDNIAESKRKLIAELVTISTEAYDFDKAFRDETEAQKRIVLSTPSSSVNSSLSESEQKAINDKFNAGFTKMLDRMTDKVSKEIDFKEFTSRQLAIIYDKYYSENELKDLIAFYKTPTGKKTLMSAQLIQTDLMKVYESELVPRILKISKEIGDQEIKNIEKQTVSDEIEDVDNF